MFVPYVLTIIGIQSIKVNSFLSHLECTLITIYHEALETSDCTCVHYQNNLQRNTMYLIYCIKLKYFTRYYP